MQLIIGNIIALIGSFVMLYEGFQKDKNKIIFFEIIQISLFIIASIILGGYTGAIINILCLVRDIILYKDKMNKYYKLVLIVLAITLSLLFNNMGLIGLLPLMSILLYIVFMNTKNVIVFKLILVLSMMMWCIYDLAIKSYTSSAFDFICGIIHLITVIQLIKSNGLLLKKE